MIDPNQCTAVCTFTRSSLVGGGAVTYIILHGELLKLVHIHFGKLHPPLPPPHLLLQQGTQSAARTTPPAEQVPLSQVAVVNYYM